MKVGDKVKCVDAQGASGEYLTLGATYTVADTARTLVGLEEVLDGQCEFSQRRFTRVIKDIFGFDVEVPDLAPAPAPAPVPAPTEAQRRKAQPVATGVLAYFPDALLAVAEVSRIGNDQHNPGQPLHWAKEKSTDEPDALARHLIDHLRGGGEKFDSDGTRHAAKIAWRALALLQRELDAEKEKK